MICAKCPLFSDPVTCVDYHIASGSRMLSLKSPDIRVGMWAVEGQSSIEVIVAINACNDTSGDQ